MDAVCRPIGIGCSSTWFFGRGKGVAADRTPSNLRTSSVGTGARAIPDLLLTRCAAPAGRGGFHQKEVSSSSLGSAISRDFTRSRFGDAAVNRRCECHDLADELVPFVEAWKWQKGTVESMCKAVTRGEGPDHSVVILQHPPVYTMGTHSSEKFLLFDKRSLPFELHRTERGGEVTYHGPGQLVVYPILNLRDFKVDLHWYLRMLEEVVIRAVQSACGLKASRIDGLTGVWVGREKVAAIGVRVNRWITYHGLALNVSTDLSPFQNIVPCGIDDRPVGSLHQLLKPGMVQPHEGGQVVAHGSDLLSKSLGGPGELVDHKHGRTFTSTPTTTKRGIGGDREIFLRVKRSLLTEFEDVFQLELVALTRPGPRPGPQIVIQDSSISDSPTLLPCWLVEGNLDVQPTEATEH